MEHFLKISHHEGELLCDASQSEKTKGSEKKKIRKRRKEKKNWLDDWKYIMENK